MCFVFCKIGIILCALFISYTIARAKFGGMYGDALQTLKTVLCNVRLCYDCYHFTSSREIGSGKNGRQPRAVGQGGWLISLPADKVGKALWVISEKKPGKHRENSLQRADEPTVGILHWGLETWAPGCWKHWRESREKWCSSLQNRRPSLGGSQREMCGL